MPGSETRGLSIRATVEDLASTLEPSVRFAALHGAWREAPDDPALGRALRTLAGEGYAPAAFALAKLAFDAPGTRVRDTAAAFGWSLRAAHSGFAAAAAMVGDFYLHAEPEHGACTRDVFWHDQAALAGHAGAALAASDSHRMGRGTPRDFERGWFFLRIALHVDPAPPPLTDVLVPSLLTDLGDERRPIVDAQVEPLLAALPRADASLEGFWRTLTEDAGARSREGGVS